MEFRVELPGEEEHEHDEVVVDVFSIVEDGKEVFFEKLAEYEGYWICQEVFLDESLERIVDRGNARIFKLILHDGEEFLEYTEDEEARGVFERWKESVEEINDQLKSEDTLL